MEKLLETEIVPHAQYTSVYATCIRNNINNYSVPSVNCVLEKIESMGNIVVDIKPLTEDGELLILYRGRQRQQ